jgi:nucleotide-binding universal stress UspA family protein
MNTTTQADLLVHGSRGHHALARLLGGSMSAQFALHADCPIVVVPTADRS